MSIRVLIADDQAVVRSGLRTILEQAPDIEVVAEAAEGGAAVELALRRAPDVALVDLRMPGVDGLEATRRIAAGGSCAVIAITAYDTDEYLYGALAAGASGFLLKSVEPAQLVSAVRIVARGDGVIAPEVTRRVVSRFAQLQPSMDADPGTLDLTAREREVLLLLAEGLSNAEIATRLTIEPATVKRHVGKLFAKLGVCSRSQAIVLAFRAGFVSPGDR